MPKILNGPSKWDLMISLFEGNPRDRKKVQFCLDYQFVNQRVVRSAKTPEGSIAFTIAINSVEQEDGSGESWNFTGWSSDMGSGHQKIRGYYSTSSRTGRIIEDGKEER